MTKRNQRKMKFLYKNKIMEIEDLTKHITKEDFIALLENLDSQNTELSFYRAIELALLNLSMNGTKWLTIILT